MEGWTGVGGCVGGVLSMAAAVLGARVPRCKSVRFLLPLLDVLRGPLHRARSRCLLPQLLGGYLYFHKAPSAQEFFEETRDKVGAARDKWEGKAPTRCRR